MTFYKYPMHLSHHSYLLSSRKHSVTLSELVISDQSRSFESNPNQQPK